MLYMEGERRFSYIVEDYFTERGTFPILLSFPDTSSDGDFIQGLRDRLVNEFWASVGVDVIDARVIEDEYQTAILIELSGSDYVRTRNNTPIGKERCIRKSRIIYSGFSEENPVSVGFQAGESVYSAAVLETLGREFFKDEKT